MSNTTDRRPQSEEAAWLEGAPGAGPVITEIYI